MKALIAIAITLSSVTSFASDLYYFNCSTIKAEVSKDMDLEAITPARAQAALVELGTDGKSPGKLFSALAASNVNYAQVKTDLYVTVPKASYDQDQDPAKALTFAYACIYGFLFEKALGQPAWNSQVNAQFQIPADANLIEINP